MGEIELFNAGKLINLIEHLKKDVNTKKISYEQSTNGTEKLKAAGYDGNTMIGKSSPSGIKSLNFITVPSNPTKEERNNLMQELKNNHKLSQDEIGFVLDTSQPTVSRSLRKKK